MCVCVCKKQGESRQTEQFQSFSNLGFSFLQNHPYPDRCLAKGQLQALTTCLHISQLLSNTFFKVFSSVLSSLYICVYIIEYFK